MVTFIREELAWAAGFFDGEGHVRSASHTGRYHRGQSLGIDIGQSGDTDVLEHFANAVHMPDCIRGPYILKNPKWKPVYYFRVHGFEKTQAVMAMIWPWLGVVKREQYKAALDKWKHRENRGTGGRPKKVLI